MDQKIPYDDYQLPVVFLPSYENPPTWIPPQDVRKHCEMFICLLLTTFWIVPILDNFLFFNLFCFLLSCQRVNHPDFNNELTQFLPRTIILKKPPGAQLGFNIRGGKASQLGIFISKASHCCFCCTLIKLRCCFLLFTGHLNKYKEQGGLNAQKKKEAF